MPFDVSQRLTIAAPHHTWRQVGPSRPAVARTPKKKPRALLPWAESTNGGGGGDNRCGGEAGLSKTGHTHCLKTSVEAFLLQCNNALGGGTRWSARSTGCRRTAWRFRRKRAAATC